MNYYSQFGVDRFLYENYFILYSHPGIFVDIGAHDGITGSNSFFFEKLGWQGVCFEPMPEAYAAIRQVRKCLLSNKAISDFEGEAEFLDIQGYSEQLSGLLDNYSEEHKQRINKEILEHNQIASRIKVQCGLFNKEVFFTDIDILSIDTEGSESKIIRSIDFNYFNIKFIVAEFNYHDQDLMNYLNSKGYHVVIKLGIDLIFKKN